MDGLEGVEVSEAVAKDHLRATPRQQRAQIRNSLFPVRGPIAGPIAQRRVERGQVAIRPLRQTR